MTGSKTAKWEYPVIGGPLDGMFVNALEFDKGMGIETSPYYRPRGQFAKYRDEYEQYNCAVRRARRREQLVANGLARYDYPGMVWVHTSLLDGRKQRRVRNTS